MNEQLDIKLFDKGLVTSVEQGDLPIDSAAYSENIDSTANGLLRGIPASSAKTIVGGDTGKNIKKSAWLRRDTGEYDLVFSNGTEIRAITDFYGSAPTESSAILTTPVTSMVAQNKAIYIGTGGTKDTPPKWVGRTDWNLFGGIGRVTETTTPSPIGDSIFIGGQYNGTQNVTAQILIYSHMDAAGSIPAYETIHYSDNGGGYYSFDTLTTDSHYIGNDIFLLANGLKIYIPSGTRGTYDVNEKWGFNLYTSSGSIVGKNAELVAYEDFSAVPANGTFKISSVTASSGSTGIKNAKRRYKYSLTYEGVSESLLSEGYVDVTPTSGQIITVTIEAKGGRGSGSSFDPRITSFNLYCAVSEDTSEDQLGSYRLCASFPIGGEFSADPSANDFFKINVLDYASADAIGTYSDIGVLGATYEARTGVPQNTDSLIINYELSAKVNGYLFTAKNYTPYIPDAQLMIFRSKELRFDMFDFVNDRLVINILPTAIAGFNGKLYVWDKNNTYIINPDGLYIENEIEGIGCSSQDSYTIIDIEGVHALVWADNNSIYMTDGSGVKNIGEPIRYANFPNDICYANLDKTVNPMLAYDSKQSSVLVVGAKGNVTGYIDFSTWIGTNTTIMGSNDFLLNVDGATLTKNILPSDAVGKTYKVTIAGEVGGTGTLLLTNGNNSTVYESYTAGSINTSANITITHDTTLRFAAFDGNCSVYIQTMTFVETPATETSVFAFNVLKRRWDYFPNFCNSHLLIGIFPGKDGETYSANGTNLVNNFGGLSNRAWVYCTPDIDFDTPTQVKAFYKAKIDSSANPAFILSSDGSVLINLDGTFVTTSDLFASGIFSIKYSIDGGNNYSTLTNKEQIKDSNGNWVRSKTIKFYISAIAGVNFLNSISIIFRRMIGKR